MKEFIKNLAVVIVGCGILFGIYFFYTSPKRVTPEISNPPQSSDNGSSQAGENDTPFPLKVPAGFKIEVFAKNLPGARVMAIDDLGNMWVSRTSAGAISLLWIKNGKVTNQEDNFTGLNNPHGLLSWGRELYIAEENQIDAVVPYSEGSLRKVVSLPTSGGGHFTRTIRRGPDDKLYVSIGSSCNVCRETDERRASIYSFNPDGSDFKQFAKGLRNTVFFTWSYVDGKMWGTEMGRDQLGDDIPPDEINILEPGKDYGWPICYGDNVHDSAFDKNQYIRDPCADKTSPKVELQAHSAPLGLGFVPEEGWPEDYWYNMIVAYHGSWNRSQPTGYKLVRIKLDSRGNYLGTEDFITGWIDGKTVYGRPVDVLIQSGSIMYVSDDKAGIIYKITYNGTKK